MLKIILRVLLVLVLLVVLAGLVLYVLASRPPASYQPAQLTQKEKEQSARQFVSHISDFNNKAQRNEAFEWQITQEQLNDYLASADEIAANRLGGRRGEVRQAMESVGLADPAVAMSDGVLTLLVRSSAYDKVVSADLAFRFTPDGKLGIRLTQTRIGQLPVPDRFLRQQLQRLKEQIRLDQQKHGESTAAATSPADSSEDVGRLLAAVIAAIDEEPITPELVGGLNHKKVRIEDLRITTGKLTVRAVPIERHK